MKVALLARELTTNGFTILTAGGPGAMEAGNLGAWMAGYSENDLSNAVRMLSKVPSPTNSSLWLLTAFEVMRYYTNENLHSNSIGVPTWFYGHEPPNPFATHIAKYFENSLREEHLLAVSSNGLIFAPGSAGTVQEIFQSACQVSYSTYTSNQFPMVLFGTDYWNRRTYGIVGARDKPVWPLLEQLGNEKDFRQQLLISDDIGAIASFICTNRINQVKP
jgi:predicted Rossmann-fold nucleotide-binding protein